jgi:alkyl sulfatase BDS1-like metallo-beta-lactamase superfamily hydrolase
MDKEPRMTFPQDPGAVPIVAGGGLATAMRQGQIPAEGDMRALCQLPGTLDGFNPMFNILEP